MDNHPELHDFDLRRVATMFRRSLSSPANSVEEKIGEDQLDGVQKQETVDQEEIPMGVDISLSDYVEAYNELNKMFPKLGGIFSFIASDVGDKTRILHEHQLSPVGEKYSFIGGMMDYEKNEVQILGPNDKSHSHKFPNGSRTLLRLHRALLFVVQFIDGIRQANDHEKTAHLARKAYDNTLAHYHPWLIRQGVHVAVYTLPNRNQLLLDLAGSNVTEEEAERVMEQTVAAGRTVYNIVQKLFEKYELLDLP